MSRGSMWEKRYEQYRRPFNQYIEPLKKIIVQIPGAQLFRLRGTYLYGGFLRFYYAYCFKHEKAPTIDEVKEYLIEGDIDVKIKVCRSSISAKLLKIAEANGGGMEYLGRDYTLGCDAELVLPETPQVSNLTGLYAMWVKWGDQMIRYEIMTTSYSALGYEEDYNVNQLTLDIYLGQIGSDDESEEKGIETKDEISMCSKITREEIMSKTVVPLFYSRGGYNFVKKVWRVRRLYKQGYSLDPKVAKELLTQCEVEIKNGIRLVIDHIKPSAPFEKGKINVNTQASVLMTLDLWMKEMKDVYQGIEESQQSTDEK